MPKTNNKKSKLKFILCTIGIAIVVLATEIVVAYLVNKLNEKPATDPDVSVTNTGIVEEKNENDGVSLEYSGYVNLFADEDKMTLNFTNPSRSNKSLSLEIVGDINGEKVTLAKTDVIEPGNKVTGAKNISGKKIEKGKYSGKFIIHFYNEHGEEEIVATEIAMTLYVK